MFVSPVVITPEDSCQNVLNVLRSSQLNFMIQESPYSCFITVRKRYKKDSSVNHGHLSHKSNEVLLKEKILHLEASVKSLSEDNVDLEVEVKEKQERFEKLEQANEELEVMNKRMKAKIENLTKVNANVINKRE